MRERIGAAAERSGRTAGDITLVAVTKTVGVDRVCEALRAGARDLGENYVQEARDKIPEVAAESTPEAPLTPRWHFIGHLQSNKARDAVRLFDLIQGVDRLSLAEEIGRQASKSGAKQPILIEVNFAPEIPGRGGALPEDVGDLAARIAAIGGVELRGLMAVAPPGEGEAARPHFRRLRQLYDLLPTEQRQVLSMGMSGDFETAIEEGATLVRIGSALFGRRKP